MNQAEFITDCLRCTQQQLKKMAGALAKKNMTDKERNDWLLTFKKMSRLYRKMLHTAYCHDALSTAEMITAWREFVAMGETVCREQHTVIIARLAKLQTPNMSMRQLYAYAKSPVLDSLARVVKMSRDFESYKDEMPAVGSSH